jgi:hypothetical protein
VGTASQLRLPTAPTARCWVTSEQSLSKDVDGSGRGLISGAILALDRRDLGKITYNFGQANWSSDPHLNTTEEHSAYS